MTQLYEYEEDEDARESGEPVSRRSRGVALGLGVFGGFFGLHRFYVGKTKTAIAMLVTLGGVGIWWLYDLVLLATGEFTDAADKPLRNWAVDAGSSRAPALRGRDARRIEDLEYELDALRQQVSELAERMDFAERLLAKPRS
jgi:hypothetical protein